LYRAPILGVVRPTTWRLPRVVLPDADEDQLWVAAGRLTKTPVDGAAALPGQFTLPGLVDSHAHLSVTHGGPGDAATATANLRELREQGVLLIRDVGAPRSVTLDLRPGADGPMLLVAGRFHAPRDRFYAAFHDPVPPEELIKSALAEIARGASWIKVVADWRSPELSYDADLLRRLVDAVHAAGARVAAHTQWEVVRDVVAAGIDSVEHGFRLDPETLGAMGNRGVAWTPTLTALNSPVPPDAAPERREFIGRAREEVRALVPVARANGVTVLAGTDTYGTIVDEVRWLVDYGLSPTEALRAATTAARAFLRQPSLEDGAPADVITFDADPREDPAVLASPAAILLRGRRIH
jgi:imidazolonepropionase-like amidohydrolase